MQALPEKARIISNIQRSTIRRTIEAAKAGFRLEPNAVHLALDVANLQIEQIAVCHVLETLDTRGVAILGAPGAGEVSADPALCRLAG